MASCVDCLNTTAHMHYFRRYSCYYCYADNTCRYPGGVNDSYCLAWDARWFTCSYNSRALFMSLVIIGGIIIGVPLLILVGYALLAILALICGCIGCTCECIEECRENPREKCECWMQWACVILMAIASINQTQVSQTQPRERGHQAEIYTVTAEVEMTE
uniref:Uncharacterized protein n=1 Tax=Branchiostoma floridae TaxID=7739 RepID=C3ZP39_BRAFL|eukprot:XP_002589763.1 hypothetical protein BRAFLDRAFT_97812 [Branchiostoma floridae]